MWQRMRTRRGAPAVISTLCTARQGSTSFHVQSWSCVSDCGRGCGVSEGPSTAARCDYMKMVAV